MNINELLCSNRQVERWNSSKNFVSGLTLNCRLKIILDFQHYFASLSPYAVHFRSCAIRQSEQSMTRMKRWSVKRTSSPGILSHLAPGSTFPVHIPIRCLGVSVQTEFFRTDSFSFSSFVFAFMMLMSPNSSTYKSLKVNANWWIFTMIRHERQWLASCVYDARHRAQCKDFNI